MSVQTADKIRTPTFFSRRQLLHCPSRDLDKGAWVKHSERPSRAESIAAVAIEPREPEDFGLDAIVAVHAADYVEFLKAAHGDWLASGRTGETIPVAWPIVRRRINDFTRIDARIGYYSMDLITPLSSGTWSAAYWSAQTAASAMEFLLRENVRAAFALCRPPGHHAGKNFCGGYCYINNAAVAAVRARSKNRRVAILDIDCHHGNGTQDIFYDDPEVLFVSIHADPSATFPYFWGYSDETGSGPGEGFNLNLPLPRGTGAQTYLSTLDSALGVIAKFDPDVLVISFGADTFAEDPFSDFLLSTDDYATISSRIAALGRPVLAVMEGGYAVAELGRNVAAFLSAFDDGP